MDGTGDAENNEVILKKNKFTNKWEGRVERK